MSAPKIASFTGDSRAVRCVDFGHPGKAPGCGLMCPTRACCFGLAAIVVIWHVLIGLWTDFTQFRIEERYVPC